MNNFDKAIKFINEGTWSFAKTMAEIPHWYCVRAKNLDKAAFNWFNQFERDNGEIGYFGKRQFIYFYLNGYKYWDCGGTIEECGLINRDIYPKKFKKKARTEVDLFTVSEDISDILQLISSINIETVLEINCGGNLLYPHLKGKCKYVGIETSEKSFNDFKIINKEAEVYHDKMSHIYFGERDLIISLEADTLDKYDLRRIENNKKKSGKVILASTKPFPIYEGYKIANTQNHYILIKE